MAEETKTTLDQLTDIDPNKVEIKQLSRKDINRSFRRLYVGAEMSNSYERLQALVFCASMSPSLEKLYPNKEELVDALQRHLVFYNTDSIPGGLILGIVLGMEQEKANGGNVPENAITSLKTGLMGPIAAIGDSIIWAAYMPILIALFLPYANQGSPWGGIIPWIVYPVTTYLLMKYLTQRGYRLGRESVVQLMKDGKMQQIIFSANVIGLMMMGALTASYVSINTPLVLGASGSEIPVQPLLDSIIPGILPLAAVLGIYFYMIKKGQSYNKILIAVIVISILGSITGIL